MKDDRIGNNSADFFKYGKRRCYTGINRRSFLKASGLTLAGLTLPVNLSSCSLGRVVYLPPVTPPVGDTTVGIARKDDIEDMVRTAIELAGGLNQIRQGDRVLLKPNLTTDPDQYDERITTHPEVLRAVLRTVKEKTDKSNITVADASAYGMATIDVAKKAGIYETIQDEEVNFSAWETEEYITVRHKSFKHIDFDLEIPKALYSFDHFINIPVLKNHEIVSGTNVDYTCCIKNHVGVLSQLNRLKGRRDIHTFDLGEKCAEINLAVPVHAMNVVDALTIIVAGGPATDSMKAAAPGLILASMDRVACDSLAVAVLRYYATEENVDKPYVNKSVWDQAQIKRAQELGLGRYPEQIKIIDENVDNINDILSKWN